MTQTLEGKVAIVTGGSRGIGLAIATEFVKKGITVAITGLNKEHLKRAESELSGAATGGAKVVTFVADVRDHAAVDSFVDETAKRQGGIDILINNAGVGWFGSFESQTREEWLRVFETNVLGVLNCCKATLPHLKSRGGGYIINISSLAGTNPLVGGASYCASKAALDMFSEVLNQEVRQDDIRVSYIKPGSVNTDFMGAGKADAQYSWKLTADDVAQVVLDLVSSNQRSLASRIDMRPSKPPKK